MCFSLEFQVKKSGQEKLASLDFPQSCQLHQQGRVSFATARRSIQIRTHHSDIAQIPDDISLEVGVTQEEVGKGC